MSRAFATAVAFALLCYSLHGQNGTGDPDALLKAGLGLAADGRYAEAADQFQRCIALQPDLFEAHYDLSLALYSLHQLPEARRSIQSVTAADRAEGAARDYLLGKIDAAAGATDKARSELASAYRANPHEENYADDYGLFLLGQGDYPTATKVLSAAAAEHPDSEYVLLGLAMSQAFSGSRRSAVLTCSRIIKADPQFSPALLLMAYSHYMSGEYAQAERAAAAGLKLPRPAPYLYYVHAASLLKTDSTDWKQMLAELDAAQKTIPACLLCYFVRSKVHEGAGDIQAAVEDLERLVNSFAPDYDSAWYRLAGLYRKQGRERDSQTALARYRQIHFARPDPELQMVRGTLIADFGKR